METDAEHADETPTQAEFLLHSLEQTAGCIRVDENKHAL